MADVQQNRKNALSSQPNASNRKNEIFDALLIILEFLLFLLKSTYFVLEAIFRRFVPAEEKSVRGEITLITGTGHGIGRQLALQYASQGAIVVCWDINKENNEDTLREIAKLGYQKAHAYTCDVTDKKQIKETAEKVLKEVGDVGILVNNAGIMPTHPLLQHTEQEIETIFNINVMAHFWILRAFLPSMLKNNHGHIVALSSCAGLIGTVNLVPYCASKFAVRGMMTALSEEISVCYPNNRIKFTTIYPYMVDTGLCKNPQIRFEKLMPPENTERVAKLIISAQRRNIEELTAPSYLLHIFFLLKLYPFKVQKMFQDFLKSEVGSDL